VAALVAAGCAALLVRPALTPLPLAGRTLGLAVLAGAVLMAGVSVPVPADVRRSNPSLVLGAGLAAVVVAGWIGGPAPPVPWAAAALPVSLLAAVAEAALFRRTLHASLSRSGPAVAVLGGAVLFAAVHVPLYGWAALPVDLGAGLLLGWQRHASGTWLVPAATHAVANLLVVVA
jgi:membrane protease YdiL (CAAX protease family)